MKFNTLGFITLAAVAAISVQSCSPDRAKAYNNRTNVNIDGVAFIKGAHEGSLTEIEASRIAQKNSTNKEVTDFAAMMIKEHTEALSDVDTLADRKYVYVKPMVNKEHQEMLDTLAKMTGAGFDKTYMAMMVKDHEEALELFEENTGSNYTDIREVAKKIAPKVEEHLKEAKKINAGLK